VVRKPRCGGEDEVLLKDQIRGTKHVAKEESIASQGTLIDNSPKSSDPNLIAAMRSEFPEALFE
jgi:hypothetical protein